MTNLHINSMVKVVIVTILSHYKDVTLIAFGIRIIYVAMMKKKNIQEKYKLTTDFLMNNLIW